MIELKKGPEAKRIFIREENVPREGIVGYIEFCQVTKNRHNPIKDRTLIMNNKSLYFPYEFTKCKWNFHLVFRIMKKKLECSIGSSTNSADLYKQVFRKENKREE